MTFEAKSEAPLNIQTSELLDAKWFDPEELVEDKNVHPIARGWIDMEKANSGTAGRAKGPTKYVLDI